MLGYIISDKEKINIENMKFKALIFYIKRI